MKRIQSKNWTKRGERQAATRAQQELNRYRNAIEAILNVMVNGDDWRELQSCADAIQDITLILCEQGFGPASATLTPEGK